MSTFTITAASEQVSLDAQNKGSVTLTVTNTTTKPARGSPKLKPLGSTSERWLSLTSGGTRNFSPEESQQFAVQIAVPPGTAPGKYSFRLNVSNEANPDEDFAEGPAVAFELKSATPAPAPAKPFPWWILIVVGVVLIGGGVTAALLLRTPKVEVPELVGQPFADASNLLAAAELQVELGQSILTGTNPVGTVVSQTPTALERVRKNATVTVVLEKSKDQVKIPNVADLPLSRVKELFGNLPLNFVEAEKRFTGQKAPGIILEQKPKADTMADAGSTVSLVVEGVSVVVPNVSQNWTLEAAVNALVNAKLAVGNVSHRVTASNQWNRVVDQNPKPDTRVPPNATVSLVVGTGKLGSVLDLKVLRDRVRVLEDNRAAPLRRIP